MKTIVASQDGASTRKKAGYVAGMTAAGLAAVVFLGIGLVSTSSFGISQVASNARSLHWTNATIGSAGIARASIAQAVFFSFDERLGVSSLEARDTAVTEGRSNLADVQALVASPDAPSDTSLVGEVESFVATGHRILDLAADGRPDQAERIRLEEFEPAFTTLSSLLDDRQSDLAAAIAESDRLNGRISRLTQLAVTLLIPGVAMFVFWVILRRRVHQQQIEMEARLEAERELSKAKDDFIAGLSHELRTPLTTIVGFSELLIEGGLDPGEEQEMLTIINAGSSDLSRMVEDLLVAARIDAGALTYSPQHIDVASQVEQVVTPYKRSGESIDVRMPPMEIYADPLHVRQILHNLVSNARRHGGDHIVITGSLEGTKAILVVADNGPGLPSHVEENLFERFVNRGTEALITGSVGLGLAISSELARGLGGSIHYKRVNGWTTFTVRLRGLPAGQEPVSTGALSRMGGDP